MAVNDAFAACVAGSLARSFSAAFWTFSTSRWENIADAADLLQSTCSAAAYNCRAVLSVARYHPRVNTVSQARMYKLYSLPSDWQRLHVDMTVLALDHGEDRHVARVLERGVTFCGWSGGTPPEKF